MRNQALLLALVLLGAPACGDDDGGGNNTGNNNNNTNQPPVCGNGLQEAGEACDDGAANSDTAPDACRTNCRAPACGDGVQDGGEACDDGNSANDDACLTACGGASDCCVANVCGDGFVNALPHTDGDPVESCDDGNTADDAVCRGDCRQDMTLCGDGQVDPGEGCDQGASNSDTAPNACRRNCQAAYCGDGVIDSGEQCEGTDLGSGTCGSEGFVGGDLACDASTCAYDTSGCVVCSSPGELDCSGACVQTLSDPMNCGGCGATCASDEVCVAGNCEGAGLAWPQVGDAALALATSVMDLDLQEIGGQAAVGYAADLGFGTQVAVKRKDPATASWYNVGPAISDGYAFVQPVVALAKDGTYLYAAFGESDSPPAENIHVVRRQLTDLLGAWQVHAAPGFVSSCLSHQGLDLAVAGNALHVVTLGSGGCGIGVDYTWWENASGWQQRPSATMFAGQLTMNGNGQPAVAVTDQAWVALPDGNGGASTLQVLSWDANGTQWAAPWSALDQNGLTGYSEDMALVAGPYGALYAAWVEADTAAGTGNVLYAARLDPAAGTWALLGAGPVDPAAEARAPSLAMYGHTPWIAYIDETGGVPQVRVRAFDGSSAWAAVGGVTNVNPAAAAARPVLAIVVDRPHVAWIEGGNTVYVKRFP